jgi:hypothetical protein
MIARDKRLENETQLAFYDYLASFWNAEAVRKAQEIRSKKELHSFKGDEEFEDSIVSGEYRKNELLDAVLKMRKAQGSENFDNKVKEYSKVRIPGDMSSINNMLEKFNK